MTPSKSMPQKRNNDFTERYPNIKVSTCKPMCIKDILTNTRFFCRKIRKTHNDLRFCKKNENAHGC